MAGTVAAGTSSAANSAAASALAAARAGTAGSIAAATLTLVTSIASASIDKIPIPGSRARGSYAVPTVHVPTVHVNVRRSGYVGGGARRGGGGGGGGHGRRSDIRLKHDIVLVGHLDNGLGYYRFSYNGSDKAYVGVMAQEVQAVMPEAVVRGSDGYLRVYYNRLGIRMQTWNEWVASGQGIPPTAAIQH